MITRRQVNKLAHSVDQYIADVFGIISGGSFGDSGVRLSSAQVDEISATNFDRVKSNYVMHGKIQSLDEARDSVQIKMSGALQKLAGDMMQGGLVNPPSGAGTLLDPSMYSYANIPVMLGPYEGSSVYAQGGLPKSIIDKKSRAMILDGATFKGFEPEFWNQDRLQKLEDAAETTGFNDKCSDAICSAFRSGTGKAPEPY